MNYNLVLKSENHKLGPIPATISDQRTCPSTCPLKGAGCYGESGPISFVWNAISKARDYKTAPKRRSFRELCDAIRALPSGTVWRHNQVGDLPGVGTRIATRMLSMLTKANQGKRGFTYTHKPLTRTNRQAIRQANRDGFTINLSTDSLKQADQALALKIAPVVLVCPVGIRENFLTPAGNRVVMCPAQTHAGVTCQKCKLCAWPERPVIIGFEAHGAMKRMIGGGRM